MQQQASSPSTTPKLTNTYARPYGRGKGRARDSGARNGNAGNASHSYGKRSRGDPLLDSLLKQAKANSVDALRELQHKQASKQKSKPSKAKTTRQQSSKLSSEKCRLKNESYTQLLEEGVLRREVDISLLRAEVTQVGEQNAQLASRIHDVKQSHELDAFMQSRVGSEALQASENKLRSDKVSPNDFLKFSKWLEEESHKQKHNEKREEYSRAA